MSFSDENPGYKLTSEEEARNWILELISDLELLRADCNVIFPDDEGRTASWQIKAYRKFLVKHGSVLGSVMALHRSGLIGDVAYTSLRERAVQTLAPSIVGVK